MPRSCVLFWLPIEPLPLVALWLLRALRAITSEAPLILHICACAVASTTINELNTSSCRWHPWHFVP